MCGLESSMPMFMYFDLSNHEDSILSLLKTLSSNSPSDYGSEPQDISIVMHSFNFGDVNIPENNLHMTDVRMFITHCNSIEDEERNKPFITYEMIEL